MSLKIEWQIWNQKGEPIYGTFKKGLPIHEGIGGDKIGTIETVQVRNDGVHITGIITNKKVAEHIKTVVNKPFFTSISCSQLKPQKTRRKRMVKNK